MAIKLLVNDYPQRSVVLATGSYALVFRRSSSSDASDDTVNTSAVSFPSIHQTKPVASKFIVEFSETKTIPLTEYSAFTSLPCLGCLGLICVNGDTFLCVVTSSRQVATVRPSETVSRIDGVQFRMASALGAES